MSPKELSLLPRRFNVPCSQSIGPKNSKSLETQSNIYQGKIGKTERLIYGPNFETVTH